MGLNNENAGFAVFDLETAPLAAAADYVEEPTAPSNYKDPAKIAAYIAEAKAGLIDGCALDPDLNRIVALGFELAGEEPVVFLCDSEEQERIALQLFWQRIGDAHLVGFNCLDFDLPVLFRRALYLDVRTPSIAIDRYRHPRVTDLLQLLSFGDIRKRHSLDFYAKRLGLQVADPLAGGAAVGQAVKDGRLDLVQQHCYADICRTARLAHRLGVFPKPFIDRVPSFVAHEPVVVS